MKSALLISMKKSKFFILTALLFSIMGFMACKNNEESEALVESKPFIVLQGPEKFLESWSKKNEVMVHVLSEPDNLHPTNGNSLTRSEMFLYLHGALLKTDLRTGKILPYIAKSLPVLSADQKSLAFELRTDIRWDDGTPVTAEDVVFTIKAAKNPLTNNPSMKPYFDFVEEVIPDPSDKMKFTIRMKSVYIQNLALWADYPIIQEKFYDSTGVLRKISFTELNSPGLDMSKLQAGREIQSWAEKFNSAEYGFDPALISGMGPYRVSSWQQGQMVVLSRKARHWTENSSEYSEKSYPEKIIFKVNKDPVTLELALKKQEFDVSMAMPIRTLLKLKEDSVFNLNYHGNFVDIYGYTFIGLNMKPEEKSRALCLKEKSVRKALALLTPVDRMIQVVNRGVNKRVTGPVAYMKSSCNTDLKPIPFDIPAANKLLDEAGWNVRDADGVRVKMIDGVKTRIELSLLYMTVIPEWKEMGMMIAEAMAQAGIKITLDGVDPGVWMEKGTSHDFDMMMGTWNNTALPEDYAQLWARESWSNNGLNFTGYGTAATDSLIQQISVTMDDHKRDSLEKKMQADIYDEQAYIFIYGLVRRSAVHRRFEGGELYAERPGILCNLLRVPGAGVKAGVTP